MDQRCSDSNLKEEEVAPMQRKDFIQSSVPCGLALILVVALSGCTGRLPSLGVASIPSYPIAADENKIKALRLKY